MPGEPAQQLSGNGGLLPSSGVNRQQERKIVHLQKQLIKLGKFIPAYDLLSQKWL